MVQYTKVPEHPHSENPLLPLITDPADPLAPIALRSTQLEPNDDIFQGPLEKVYLFWIVGASCDGCTIAVTGATHPRLEVAQAPVAVGRECHATFRALHT